MVRFTNIALAYFVIGATMWAGGAIAWDKAGMGGVLIDVNGDTVSTDESATSGLEDTGGILGSVGQFVDAAGLAIIWNLLFKLVGYLFWPITVLQSVNAPTQIVVLVGGTFTFAFFGSVLRIIRTGA